MSVKFVSVVEILYVHSHPNIYTLRYLLGINDVESEKTFFFVAEFIQVQSNQA